MIRSAIDRLPDPEASIEERLQVAEFLVSADEEKDLPVGMAFDQLEREFRPICAINSK